MPAGNSEGDPRSYILLKASPCSKRSILSPPLILGTRYFGISVTPLRLLSCMGSPWHGSVLGPFVPDRYIPQSFTSEDQWGACIFREIPKHVTSHIQRFFQSRLLREFQAPNALPTVGSH